MLLSIPHNPITIAASANLKPASIKGGMSRSPIFIATAFPPQIQARSRINNTALTVTFSLGKSVFLLPSKDHSVFSLVGRKPLFYTTKADEIACLLWIKAVAVGDGQRRIEMAWP